MIKKKLEEYLDYKQPQPYIVSNEQYSNEYKTPVLTAGKSFLLGMTNDTKGIYPASKDEPIILFDDFTTDIKWVDFPFKVKSSACKILVPRNDTNLRFCYYGMKSLNFDASQHKRYWISQYSQMQLPDYPNARKAEIVERLSRIENQINIKENQLNKLDSLVKSRFNEMFGDVLTNDKGYKTCAFGEYVIQMNIGPFGSAMKNDVFVPENKGYCMVYEQKHAIDKDMNVSARYVDETTYKALKRFEVGPGDIIVSCRGTIGECFIIPEGSPNGIIHPSLMMIKPKLEVNHKFLVFLLEQILAEQTQDGSGVKMAIKAKDLSKIQTIHPPRELQDSFISFVELIDKSRFIVQSQIKDLQELLDSKMDEYFGGDEE